MKKLFDLLLKDNGEVLAFVSIVLFCTFLFFIIQGIVHTKWNKKQAIDISDISLPIQVKLKFRLEDGFRVIQLSGVRVTAYTNRREETDSTPNITASGRYVYEGSCAVSQDIKARFGDIVFIDKTGQAYIVEDKMNARLKNSVDIFMDKDRLAEARVFGFSSKIYVIQGR